MKKLILRLKIIITNISRIIMSFLFINLNFSLANKVFGVSLKDMMVSASAAGAGGAGAAAEEKSEYTLHLAEVGASKMNIIKLVKEVAGLGLKEAKEKVDGAPSVIKENVPEAEAKEIKKKFEEAGAKLELK